MIGWKEFELEVMRDGADNFVVICSIENIDPMGVHTGDSITVAPALTLTDKEYQRMRDCRRAASSAASASRPADPTSSSRSIPADGRMIVIEMNPRVSRSSALASKATGFPIAKIAAKLALGYRLDEIPERHHARHAGVVRADHRLRGRQDPALELREVPAGRSHADDADEVGGRGDGDRPHLQGSVPQGHSLARARQGRPAVPPADAPTTTTREREDDEEEDAQLRRQAGGADTTGGCGRCSARSTRAGTSSRLHELTNIDPWFLEQFAEMVELRRTAEMIGLRDMSHDLLRTLKRAGFGDHELADILGVDEVRGSREAPGAEADSRPSSASTPAPPSSSRSRRISTAATKTPARRIRPTSRRSSSSAAGPNRIGQGIEFDYCCCHAVFGFARPKASRR